MGMELLPEEAKRDLPRIGAQSEREPREVMIYLKYRHPASGWCWYVMEGEATGDEGEEEEEVEDFMFFGFVKGIAQEYGTFMLSDLEGWPTDRGIVERVEFTPALLPVVAAADQLDVAWGEEDR